MANTKISALTSATTPLAGTETLPIVQSNTTKKVSVDNLTVGKTVQMDKLLTGTGDASTGANLRKYTAIWNTSPNTYFVPAGNIFGMIGDAVAGQENWFGFTGGYATSSGSVNILLQQNLRNLNEQAGNFIGSEATSSTSADIILGKMVAGSTAAGNSTKSIQFRFTSAGNLKPVTAGNGIDFSANTPAAGMTSQLLNWYEEGTWTPAQGGGLVVVGAFSSTGTYTRVGRQVTVVGTMSGATSIATTAGGVFLGGLPFSTASGTYATGVAINAAITAEVGTLASGSAMYSSGALPASGTIFFSLTYQTA